MPGAYQRWYVATHICLLHVVAHVATHLNVGTSLIPMRTKLKSLERMSLDGTLDRRGGRVQVRLACASRHFDLPPPRAIVGATASAAFAAYGVIASCECAAAAGRGVVARSDLRALESSRRSTPSPHQALRPLHRYCNFWRMVSRRSCRWRGPAKGRRAGPSRPQCLCTLVPPGGWRVAGGAWRVAGGGWRVVGGGLEATCWVTPPSP